MRRTVEEIADPRWPAGDSLPQHNHAMTETTSTTARTSVRFATRGDVATIVSLIRELAVYEHLEHLATATPAKLEPQLFGNRPACECLIGELDGQAVGFALFFHNFSTFLCQKGLYLEDLFVRPSARGAGLGKLLLQRLAQIAVERDCGRFEWAVLDWNVDAQAFYQRMGATMLPDWRLCRVTADALHDLAGTKA
jgi:GNAT superfamily N-acetyltransferase